MGKAEVGPTFGVELIETLPLGDGGMLQAMPSRKDLESIQHGTRGPRVAAAYEVLLEHYQNACKQRDGLVRAAVRAFRELNEIRDRDGIPYTHMGYKSSVDEEYFSSVIDGLNEAVKEATGKSAHCHPELYTTWDK